MNSKIGIIITAAGSSTRIGGGIKKEYLPYKNGTVLSSSVKIFLTTCNKYNITDFIITCPVNCREDCKKSLLCDNELTSILQQYKPDFINITEGSSTRQKSVYNGLLAVKNNPDIILIHDGARPFITSELIIQTINAVEEYEAAVPGLIPTDTQKKIDKDGFIIEHLQRNTLFSVQTPQGFNFKKLFTAHKKALYDNIEYTDDTEIWGKYCGSVKTILGIPSNIKITYPKDLYNL